MSRGRRRRLAPPLAGAVLLACLASPVDAGPLAVESLPVPRFCGPDGRDLAGGLGFVGGFAYAASGLGGVSAFRFLDESGGPFLAVTDGGFWFTGAIERDGEGRPVGIGGAQTAPIRDADGSAATGKLVSDAEALSIAGSRILVGFERRARILAFDGDDPLDAVPSALPLPIPRAELRANGGIETIATAPAGSPLGGASVAVAEKSVDRAGNLFAAVFGAADPALDGVFTLRRDEGWDATDGAFLPGGDLLVLERQFTGYFGRIGTRIRRVASAAIRPGAVVDGPVVAEADLSCEIDNMEGIALFRGPEGETRLALVSDDNRSFLQRSLYLEFRFLGPD